MEDLQHPLSYNAREDSHSILHPKLTLAAQKGFDDPGNQAFLANPTFRYNVISVTPHRHRTQATSLQGVAVYKQSADR
jgi:hypothetical protein